MAAALDGRHPAPAAPHPQLATIGDAFLAVGFGQRTYSGSVWDAASLDDSDTMPSQAPPACPPQGVSPR